MSCQLVSIENLISRCAKSMKNVSSVPSGQLASFPHINFTWKLASYSWFGVMLYLLRKQREELNVVSKGPSESVILVRVAWSWCFSMESAWLPKGMSYSLVLHKQFILPCVQMVCASKALLNLEDIRVETTMQDIPLFMFLDIHI